LGRAARAHLPSLIDENASRMSSWILLTSVAALVTTAVRTGVWEGDDVRGVAGVFLGRPGRRFVGEGVAGTCASPGNSPGGESPGDGFLRGRPGRRFVAASGVPTAFDVARVVFFFSAPVSRPDRAFLVTAFGSSPSQPAQNQSPAGTPRRPRKRSKRSRPVDADPAADADPTAAASSEDVTGMDGDVIGMDAETVVDEAWERGRWLLGLLVLQSSSSVVLQHYGDLVRDNLIITLFLTMLVGAGGNAGNQSAIRVIRGLATGEMVTTRECFVGTLWRQARVGFLLASFLSAGGFARVMVTEATGGLDAAGSVGGVDDPPAAVGAFGIALSLFCIVTLSTVAGTAMPFALAASGQDPANAGTTIQVVMDIMGVVITCVVCSLVFTQVPGMLAAVGG